MPAKLSQEEYDQRLAAHRQLWVDAGIEYGLCLCGCGQKTKPYTQTHTKQDKVKGAPARHLVGHNKGVTRLVSLSPTNLRCSVCGKLKNVENFTIRTRRGTSAYTSDCKKCQSTYRKGKANHDYISRGQVSGIRRDYGITVADWDAKFEEQEGKCGICKKPFYPDSNVPHVDHCHTTGEVGMLLCRSCNCMLGYSGDDPETLEKGAEYLRTHRKIATHVD